MRCLSLGLLALACDQSRAPSVTRERSQAVEIPASNTAVVAPASTPSASTAPRPQRVLCDGRLRAGKPLPELAVGRAASSGDPPKRAIGSPGRWTWVNFWAAWCAPCKEEIPRLRSWGRQLASKQLDVVFVSLDDDERQLRNFLASGALEQTYWLREGKERDDWMSEAALDPDPELPFHLLVDPRGRVRCRIQGAVEDHDLPELVRLLDGA